MRFRAGTTAKLLSLTVLALALLGCGGDKGAAEKGSLTTPPAAPASGWEKFAAEGIEIWLPSSYEGGEPAKGDLDAVVRALELAGRSDYAKYVEAAKSAFVLLMVDNDFANLGASVAAGKVAVPSALGLDAFVELNIRQLPAGVVILERKTHMVGKLPAVRLTVEINAGFLIVKEYLYLFKSANDAWVVVYGASKSEFERNAPIFEESANRLKVN